MTNPVTPSKNDMVNLVLNRVKRKECIQVKTTQESDIIVKYYKAKDQYTAHYIGDKTDNILTRGTRSELAARLKEIV